MTSEASIPAAPTAPTIAPDGASPPGATPGIADVSITDLPADGASEPSAERVLGDQERDQQIRLKSEGGKLLLTLPTEGSFEQDNPAQYLSWAEIFQQLKQRLHAGGRLWQADTTVHLNARDRLLDGRQLQEIADSLAEVQLRLKRVYTSRRQTAVAAATAGYSVEQQSSIAQINPSGGETAQALAEPLYLQTTLRSGSDVKHNGTVIVLGDLNPGSSVVADGDILVWGRLRGTVHAGARSNAQALIMALQMEPTQIRIADFVARPPENPPAEYYPEVAYVTPQGTIRIAKALDFHRAQTSSN